MISKWKSKYSVFVSPGDSCDLLSLRRVVKPGDRVAGETMRVIKRSGDYCRPGKGERVKVRMVIEVSKLVLDGSLDRLRITGTIIESSNENIGRGSSHSLVIEQGRGITVTKRSWDSQSRRMLRGNGGDQGLILVAIDTGECGIGRLFGTHLDRNPNIYSGSSGKRYKTKYDGSSYMAACVDATATAAMEDDKIIVFGPGETRKKFNNTASRHPVLSKHEVISVDGIDTAGEDGLIAFCRSRQLGDISNEGSLQKAVSIVDRVMEYAGRTKKMFAMGFDEVSKAASLGAVESVVFSGSAIDYREQELVNLLDLVEKHGSTTIAVDSSTDIGLRVDGLGGIAALLRYEVSL